MLYSNLSKKSGVFDNKKGVIGRKKVVWVENGESVFVRCGVVEGEENEAIG